jgi:hypothetical protein
VPVQVRPSAPIGATFPSMTLDQIVDDYIENFRSPARRDLGEFRKLPDLRQAIRHASLCNRLPCERRHPHQYRIPTSVLRTAERTLRRAQHLLSGATSFELLYGEIESKIGDLHGIGALTIYDIALRIGAYLRKKPNLVYLHRGTRVGARRLGFAGKALDPRSLPSAFSRLTPDEIEDCLCIYKDEFLPSRLQTRLPRWRRACKLSPTRQARSC